MGLEATTYINGLVPTNPTGSDGKSQGDDHIRLIKSALKNTFPNVTGAVTATHTQLNKVVENGVFCFPGMIVAFSGTQAQIPAGWQLCNGVGTTTLGSAVPDLRQKFIYGATGDAGSLPRNTTGGATTHSHIVLVNGHALTVSEMPPHNHQSGTLTKNDITTVFGAVSSSGGSGAERTTTNQGRYAYTSTEGSGSAHSHGAGSSSSSNVPPYLALMYIVKL